MKKKGISKSKPRNKQTSLKGSYLPHGGTIVNRFLPEAERSLYLEKTDKSKTYTITDADLSALYRIADGTLSPLEGPMGRKEFYGVLENEYITRKGSKYAWTIPIAFPVSKADSRKLKVGETIALKNMRGVLVGLLEISDIYRFNKPKYNKVVYGFKRDDHPGTRIVNLDKRDYLIGGKIWAFPEFKHPLYRKYMLDPEECRALFKSRGWERIVAFQTRNPLHRAHEYAIVHAMEVLSKKGFFTGGALNPLVGETKSDDVPADIRMRTYEALIDKHLIGLGDKDKEFWRAKGYKFSDQLTLIGLDIKMFYAGPKEAVMHAIYRQNLGFTDIIIGRRHADAPFDDGTPAWGDFDAQNKFDKLKGRLLIKPFKVGPAVYFKELKRVALADDYKGNGYSKMAISGKELRNKLRNKEPIDQAIMRKEVVSILRDAYRHNISALSADIKSKNITWHDPTISKSDRERRNNHRGACVWLTGLSCSGKSTIAVDLQRELFNMGCQAYILDGDNIRHGLNKDLGFNPEDRTENIRRIGEVARLFTEAGFITIVAFISPYRKDRDDVRTIFRNKDFIETYVKASLTTCEKRDTKGLYKRARLGEIQEFTGISAPYEEPVNPEIIINTGNQSKEESVKIIFDYLLDSKYIFAAGESK